METEKIAQDVIRELVSQEDVQNGDVFRWWTTSLATGNCVERFQRLSRGNPCRITESHICDDYDRAECWGPSYNNLCSMPHPAIRISKTANVLTGVALPVEAAINTINE